MKCPKCGRKLVEQYVYNTQRPKDEYLWKWCRNCDYEEKFPVNDGSSI